MAVPARRRLNGPPKRPVNLSAFLLLRLRRNRQDSTTKDNQAGAANGSSGGAPGTSGASIGAGSKLAVGQADQKMMTGMMHANISAIMAAKLIQK
jgi:hypothetical protein